MWALGDWSHRCGHVSHACGYWFADFDGWQPCHCDGGNEARHVRMDDKRVPESMPV